jgi:hypothetical protein
MIKKGSQMWSVTQPIFDFESLHFAGYEWVDKSYCCSSEMIKSWIEYGVGKMAQGYFLIFVSQMKITLHSHQRCVSIIYE